MKPNETEQKETKQNGQQPETMVINGAVTVPGEIVASHMMELLPDGVIVVGFRVKGSDLVLDTVQPVGGE